MRAAEGSEGRRIGKPRQHERLRMGHITDQISGRAASNQARQRKAGHRPRRRRAAGGRPRRPGRANGPAAARRSQTAPRTNKRAATGPQARGQRVGAGGLQEQQPAPAEGRAGKGPTEGTQSQAQPQRAHWPPGSRREGPGGLAGGWASLLYRIS